MQCQCLAVPGTEALGPREQGGQIPVALCPLPQASPSQGSGEEPCVDSKAAAIGAHKGDSCSFTVPPQQRASGDQRPQKLLWFLDRASQRRPGPALSGCREGAGS